MVKNYFKIAWRQLKKNKLYAFVNITGFTIGIVSCLLIGLYIAHELSYDRFNKNADRIARVTMDYNFGDASRQVALTGTKVAPQFKRAFPSVQAFSRTYKRTRVVAYANKLFEEKNFLYADSSFFRIFSFPLLRGNVATSLNSSNKIVITQKIATKYFGTEEPLGKTLKVGDADFEITGVAAEVPSNSQIQFDFVASFSSLVFAREEKWMEANYVTYLLLDSKQKIHPLQKQIRDYMKNVSKTELKVSGNHYLTFYLEPLTKVHLYSSLSGFEPNSSIVYIYILTAVAILILMVACVNYVNLAAAQAAGRIEEIGIRKTFGAEKTQIFSQFIGESFLTTFIAVLIALGTSVLILPFFNRLSGKEFDRESLFNPLALSMLMLLCIVVSLMAGLYPAVSLSNMRLIRILKSGFSFSSGRSLRKSLIVFQFVVSVFLTIATIVILQQLNYIKNKDLGYNKSDIVILPLDDKTSSKYDAIKAELSSLPQVKYVTAAYGEPINVQWGDGLTDENGQEITVNAIPCDEDFVKTLGLKIIAGTDFTRADAMEMDTSDNDKNLRYSYMLNESAVKALGWKPEDAIGREVSKGVPGTVKAVLKDFHFRSLHEAITPLILFLNSQSTNSIFIKIASHDIPGTLNGLKRVWDARVTHRPFEYHFLDDDYDALYKTEQRTAKVFTTFSALAILLACLGLFALTAFAASRRAKEIGIRKVLGANIAGLVLLIAKDFLLFVIIAIMLASPIAWWATHRWLQDFAYRISIEWWVFAVAGVLAIFIALASISFQALKAAIANPVNSLRTE
jgi:putative ABC transport system permease protein